MLPFSSVDFYVLFTVFLGLVLVSKYLLSKWISYRNALLGIVLIYITLYFPAPWKAAAFVSYCYAVCYVFGCVLRLRNKLPACLLLVLPMLLVKASYEADLLAFAGLSYITFRVLQVYLDMDASGSPPDIFDFVLFMLFPCTLLAGPIDRFQRFRSDLKEGYARLNIRHFEDGWQLMMIGLLLKFIFAEMVDRYWLSNAKASSKDWAEMANNMYAYSFYLYFDFAGYSAMAAGLGRMFGIGVPENFNYPFLSVNPQDFWKRWNSTLGDWLRDYIFRPYYKWISQKRSLKNYPLAKQNSGLFLTFFIMGLWNGFQGIYIISGSIFGIYSVVHNSYVYRCRQKQRDVFFGNLSPRAVKWISVFLMFNLVCFSLYIFSGRCPY